MPEPSAAGDRVTMPLLTLITQQSLDEDYLHVAERRASEPAGSSPRRPRRTAAVVVAAFGLLVTVAAVQTSARAGVTDASRAALTQQIEDGRANIGDLQSRIVHLRELNVGLQDRLDAVSATQQAASARLARIQSSTGFGAVTGPGVRITVDDRPDGTELVKDTDLRLLVNGLWAAGAEAISINGQRLTARTAIRNSNAAIHVNVRALSPPYVVLAVGDERTLQADLMDTTSGLQFRDLADSLGFPFTMDNENQLTLPAAPPRLLRLDSAVEGTALQNQQQSQNLKQQKETQP
jgi:uncharacterized protein YlxW (UPF0749 family)